MGVVLLFLVSTAYFVVFHTGQPPYSDLNNLPSGGLKLSLFPPVEQVAWMDIEIDGEPVGRIDIGLFSGSVPKTCDNFVQLLLGTRGEELGFPGQTMVGSVFHRIIDNFVIQGGRFKYDAEINREYYDQMQFSDEPRGLQLPHA